MEQAGEGREFSYIAPAGYYIALRVGFAFPIAETNALPDAWIERYVVKYGEEGGEGMAEFVASHACFEVTPSVAFAIIERADEFASRATRWRFDG